MKLSSRRSTPVFFATTPPRGPIAARMAARKSPPYPFPRALCAGSWAIRRPGGGNDNRAAPAGAVVASRSGLGQPSDRTAPAPPPTWRAEAVVHAPPRGYTRPARRHPNAINDNPLRASASLPPRQIAPVAGLMTVPKNVMWSIRRFLRRRPFPSFIAYASNPPGKIHLASAATAARTPISLASCSTR